MLLPGPAHADVALWLLATLCLFRRNLKVTGSGFCIHAFPTGLCVSCFPNLAGDPCAGEEVGQEAGAAGGLEHPAHVHPTPPRWDVPVPWCARPWGRAGIT